MNNLGQLAAATSGFLYYYPNFYKTLDHPRLECDIRNSLCSNTAYESFVRLRVTKGFFVEDIIGNVAALPPDMVAAPFGSSEKSFILKVARKAKEPEILVAGEVPFPIPVISRAPVEDNPKYIILQV